MQRASSANKGMKDQKALEEELDHQIKKSNLLGKLMCCKLKFNICIIHL